MCSFSLIAQTSSAASLCLAGMEFKPIGKAAGRPANVDPAGTPLTSNLSEMVYGLQHEACSSIQVEQTAALKHPMPCSLDWHLTARIAVRVPAASAVAPANALQQSLQLLQSAVPAMNGSATLLKSRFLAPGVRKVSAAHAATAALIKVAAAESNGQQFVHFANSPLEATLLVPPLETSDVFGVNLTGKLLHNITA